MRIEIHNILKNFLEENPFENHPNLFLNSRDAPRWNGTELGIKFFESFKDEFKLAESNIIYQNFGGTAMVTSTKQLADMTIALANKIGVNQSIVKIENYLKSKEISVYFTLLLQSINIDEEYEFSNGVKIIHSKSIPNKFIADEIMTFSSNPFVPNSKIPSALILEYEQEKVIGDENTSPDFKWSQEIEEKVDDVLLILSLARNIEYGIQPFASCTLADEDLPFWRPLSNWHLRDYKKPSGGNPKLTNWAFTKADEILVNFNKLSKSFKTSLRIPLSKLNNYGSGVSIEERAIELRICLESIFLDDGNKEQLRYRLSLRSALFLGDTFAERHNIFKTIREAYDISSKAVHTGKLSGDGYVALDKSAELAQKALIRIIENGNKVDWTEIELRN